MNALNIDNIYSSKSINVYLLYKQSNWTFYMPTTTTTTTMTTTNNNNNNNSSFVDLCENT